MEETLRFLETCQCCLKTERVSKFKVAVYCCTFIEPAQFLWCVVSSMINVKELIRQVSLRNPITSRFFFVLLRPLQCREFVLLEGKNWRIIFLMLQIEAVCPPFFLILTLCFYDFIYFLYCRMKVQGGILLRQGKGLWLCTHSG